MSEFTPWKADTDHYGENLVRGVGGQYIAKVNWLLDTREDIARLIAAAPDMFDALQDALASLEISGQSDYVTGRVRAAIAKARGAA